MTVTDVNDIAPVITSDGGGASASLNVAENGTAVTTVTATDLDGPSLTYSIVGGADASKFTINASTGALSFVAAPDYEAPTDADADNVYDVIVQVSDGALTDSQAIAVTVTSLNEAPTALAPASAAVDINASGGVSVATLTAIDPDSGDTLSYALLGDGGGRFAVDASSGLVTVAGGARLDNQSATQFDLLVRVTDAGGLTLERLFVVNLHGVPSSSLPDGSPPPLQVPPAPVPAPEWPAAGPAAGPTPAPTESPALKAFERTPWAGLPAAGASAVDEQPGIAEDRSFVPRVQLTLRPRDDDGALVATVSFSAFGAGEGTTVVLTWDDIAGRATDALWRVVPAALHRGLAVELDDGPRTAAGDDARPSDLLAMLQDPVQVSSVTFAAGFVWWLTRGGGLLTTLLLGIPAWRHVDLLPVLARSVDDEDDEGDEAARAKPDETRPDDLDDAAVAALFDRSRGIAASPGACHEARRPLAEDDVRPGGTVRHPVAAGRPVLRRAARSRLAGA